MHIPHPSLPNADAELQIDHLRSVDETRATAVVRCIRGPVHLGARFRATAVLRFIRGPVGLGPRSFRISDCALPIDLRLTGIDWYGHCVDELGPTHGALVTLTGAGALLLRSSDHTLGYQHILGVNPPR